MRNATSILLFGASSVVLSMVACGGGDGGEARNAAGAPATAGTGTTSAGTGTTSAGTGTTSAGTGSTAGSGTGGAPACNPTAGTKKGDGTNMVIDEIDDADGKFQTAGMGVGSWDFSKDTSMGTITPNGTAMLLPVEGGHMGKGFHITGDKLTGWGGALAAILNTTANSFDASEYGGIAFWIKGTSTVETGENQVYVAPRMIELLPGNPSTCCKEGDVALDCYGAHHKYITLTPDWSEVKIAWDDLDPATYGLGLTTTFNPNRIRDIVFSFNHAGMGATGKPPEGAKFDVWIDGLRFIAKGEMGNVGTGSGGTSSGGSANGGAGGATAGGGAGGATAGGGNGGGGNGGVGGQ